MNESAQFVDTLREWTELFMRQSMGSFFHYAKEQGMSVSHIGALMRISHKGMSGVAHIGDDLGVTSAAASQMLDRLVQHGLVFRTEDPNDRRSKQIALTARGAELVRGSMETRHKWLADLAGKMSTDEIALGITALKIMITKAKEMEAADCGARPSPETEGNGSLAGVFGNREMEAEKTVKE